MRASHPPGCYSMHQKAHHATMVTRSNERPGEDEEDTGVTPCSSEEGYRHRGHPLL